MPWSESTPYPPNMTHIFGVCMTGILNDCTQIRNSRKSKRDTEKNYSASNAVLIEIALMKQNHILIKMQQKIRRFKQLDPSGLVISSHI